MSIDDKTGEALKNQRFQMLRDIAEELSEEVNFPTSFDVVVRLRDILNDPDWTPEDVATALSVEPLIASRLVGLANSAAFHTGGNKVVDVKTAVLRLGINLVRTTALAIATSQIRGAMPMSAFNELSHRLWEHSLRTASAAYVISKQYTSYNPEQAMLAGMIHDIGAFYMLYRAAQYDELLERPDTVKFLIIQWHEPIGNSLLSALGMPEEITDALREHDQPRPVPKRLSSLADIIYIANLLAGGAFEWQYMESESTEAMIRSLDSKYTDLSEEIAAHEAQLKTLFELN